MDDITQELLVKARETAQLKNFSDAINLYKKALENSKEKGDILFEIGIFMFSMNRYEDALDIFIKCCREGFHIGEVRDILLEAYYQPNIEEFRKKYEDNVEVLLEYPYIYKRKYPNFENLKFIFIPYSDYKFAIFKKDSFDFIEVIDFKNNIINEQLNNDTIVMIKNEFNQGKILVYEEKTRLLKPYLWQKAPLYMYYDDEYQFIEFLQVLDINILVEFERIVFLFGKDECKEWFKSPQTILPMKIYNIINTPTDSLYMQMKEIIIKRDENCKKMKQHIDNYYGKLTTKDILNNLTSRPPKILFITTRFSTAIQYYIRDVMKACENVGLESRLLIEKNDISVLLFPESIYESIYEFKPDMIFIIDHFRFEYNIDIPKNIIFLTWLQDQLPTIMHKDSPSKLGEFDILLNGWITAREFFNIGYNTDNIIDFVITSNPNIYRPYRLSSEELGKYSCDICSISNVGDPLKGLEILIQLMSSKDQVINKRVISALKRVYDYTYNMIYKGSQLFALDELRPLMKKAFIEETLIFPDNAFEHIVDTFRWKVIGRIYRSVPFEWLHEKGYNMKLWGREWIDHPKLSQYGMGIAENGEVLSKILNSSKITIGTNPANTYHPRVCEALFSDSFYLGLFIPEEYDWVSSKKLIKDEEIVLFKDREDLYNKVDYYLENEVERKRKTKSIRDYILNNLTYEIQLQNLIKGICNILQKNIGNK